MSLVSIIGRKIKFGALYIEKQNYITNKDAEGTQDIIVDATRVAGVLVKNGNVANYTITGSTLQVNQIGDDVWLGTKTGINIVSNEIAQNGTHKMVLNGRIVIVKGNNTYNVAGALVK